MLEMSDIGDGLYKKGFAGDTFNVVHYINRVSCGQLDTSYLSAIGQDALSEACFDFLVKSGISTSHIQRDPGRTIGLFILSNDEKGEKQYSYWRGQSAARHIFNEMRDLTGFDYIYLSGITTAVTENKENLLKSLKQAKEKGATIVFDVNHRKLLWSAREASLFAHRMFEIADIVKISDEELELLYPDQTIKQLSRLYDRIEWVLTCASEKAEVLKAGKILASHSFVPVEKVVDSSAAGDAFIATYLHAKIANHTMANAIKRAHKVASQVVCHKGSIVPIDLSKLD